MASEQEELSITIPPEIITEILYRLPAKSLGRFRCVSKSWLSQLTHPNFIKIHLNKFTRQNHLIFKTLDIKKSIIEEGSLFLHSHPFHSGETVTKFDLQLNEKPYFVEVCGSCDGLVVVRVLFDLSEKIVVINPTTKECLHLPEEDYNNYNPNNKEGVPMDNMYGFGYDSLTNDYKVVCLTYYSDQYFSYGDDGKRYVYVYSLRNKTLKRLADDSSPYGIVNSRSCGVFVNGFIHWIVSNDDGLLSIAAFSLADECFSRVPFPELCNNLEGYDCELHVLGGKLAIFITSEGVVWLMNEYGVTESWTEILLHGINKVPICKPKHETQPWVFYDNGKIMVANTDRMMVYEVEKATFTETACVWNPEIFTIAGSYIDSLVSLKLDREEKDDDAEYESEEDDDAEKNDEIKSIKPRLALVDEEWREVIAALPETVESLKEEVKRQKREVEETKKQAEISEKEAEVLKAEMVEMQQREKTRELELKNLQDQMNVFMTFMQGKIPPS